MVLFKEGKWNAADFDERRSVFLNVVHSIDNDVGYARTRHADGDPERMVGRIRRRPDQALGYVESSRLRFM